MTRLSLRKNLRGWLYLIPICALGAGLSGCDEGYPDDLSYPVRTDPLVTQLATAERTTPDRPGQLPLFVFADLNQPSNPLAGIKEEEKKAILNAMKLPAADRRQLGATLEKIFGTPAEPKIQPQDEEQLGQIKALKLERKTLREGSILYRQQCLHCHGLTGDGRGPTARWVNPHPRDYRQGIFKFTSVDQDIGVRKPRRADIIRVMEQGIDGTSMPSFNILTEEQKEALASYVIHLSIRGECEFEVIKSRLISEESESVDDQVQTWLSTLLGRWVAAQSAEIKVSGPYPYQHPSQTFLALYVKSLDGSLSASEEEAFGKLGEEKQRFDRLRQSVQNGRNAFLAEKAGESGGCRACHPNFGRQSTYRFDSWGTMVRPTDLTRGIYRGGRRPLDLYWRIYSGINGSGMAPFKTLASTNPAEDKVWDLVNFLQVLPYPRMYKVYGIDIDG